MILACHDLTKAYGTDIIIEGASFHIEENQKAAITGINGAGKTTLLKMITGELAPDRGSVVVSKNASPGYLAQYQDTDSCRAIYDEVLSARPEILDMEADLRKMEAQMGTSSGDELEQLINRYHRTNDMFMRMGGDSYRSEVAGVIKGLGFTDEDMQRSVNTLSGGQKTRVFLGKLLVSKPNLLMLDEPTNHLDMNSIAWLENYLLNYNGAVLIVSHDRYFLNKIVSKVIEVFNHHVYSYDGNYDDFALKKSQLIEAQMKAYLNQQKEIARQEEVIRKLKSFNREKSIKRAESREKMLGKIDRLEKPEEENTDIHITLEPAVVSGNDVLSVEHLSKAFGANRLFDDISFEIKRGERVALIGDNGTGKTTILKILNGLCEADAGKVVFGTNVHIGYYDQEQAVLHPEKTLFEELQDEHPDMNNTAVRNVLAAFLFTNDDVFKKVADLSGGERGRVSLAKLMLSEANLIILDEPTNHLDMTSRQILENALNNYTGTVLFVSHDRYFINQTATRILDLTMGSLVNYIGNYDYYLEKKDVQMRTLLEELTAKRSGRKQIQPHDRSGNYNDISGNHSSLNNNCRAEGLSDTCNDYEKINGSSIIAADSGPNNSGKTDLCAAGVKGNDPVNIGDENIYTGDSAERRSLSGAEAYKARKAEQARERKLKNQLAKAEDKISELEETIKNLEEQMMLPENATDAQKLTELSKAMETAQQELEAWYDKWTELSEEAEG